MNTMYNGNWPVSL